MHPCRLLRPDGQEPGEVPLQNPNATAFYCSSISDLNGNTIMVNRNASDRVSSVVDPTNRTLTFTYTGGLLTAISDPLSRSWMFTCTGSDLKKITYLVVSC